MAAEGNFYRAAERRIERLTLALGVAAALVVAIRYGWRAALGLALGAALAWVNYRWLKQAVDTLARLAAAQAEASRARVPRRVYVKFLGRFALLIVVVYVILSHSLLPGPAVLAGLFVLVAAVIVELLYELTVGTGQTNSY